MSTAKTHPEIVFDRYFRSDRVTLKDRGVYRGKCDLSKVDEGLSRLLQDVQDSLNKSLAEQQNIVGNTTFHFDYVDASVQNAIAFTDGVSSS